MITALSNNFQNYLIDNNKIKTYCNYFRKRFKYLQNSVIKLQVVYRSHLLTENAKLIALISREGCSVYKGL